MLRFVAYYRVSTRRQGTSGLGLAAQKAAVAAYSKASGGKIIAEYTEVESGKRVDRPQLTQAIGHARLAKATLVIAKLDRLARNVSFTAGLMDSGVDFVACDNPHANKLTIHILAAVAESEATAISIRTRDALAAAKRRGKLLGSHRPGHWEGREHKRAKGLRKAIKAAADARTNKAREAYSFLLPTIREQRAAGDSLQAIADTLNQAEHRTTAGKPFSAVAVMRLLRR